MLLQEEKRRTKQAAMELRLQKEAQNKARRQLKMASKKDDYDSDLELQSEAITPTTTPTNDESLQQVVDEISLMEWAATPARSRRSQKINLPTRFCD